MAAFIWNTNHLMWKVVPPFPDSLTVLKAYITNPAAYVYWSTPRFQDDIKAGDIAYVFCTVDKQGIVARGRVAEPPRQLTLSNAAQFAYPAQLNPPGWDEQIAPSSWKTGIAIERTFWDVPLTNGKPAVGTVGRVSDELGKAIEAEIAAR